MKRLCDDCPILEREFYKCNLGYTILEYEYSLDCRLIKIVLDGEDDIHTKIIKD